MKNIITLLLLVFVCHIHAQTHYNTKEGLALEGYDAVSYFNSTPKKGSKNHSVKFNNITYQFSSQKNLELFNKNPQAYMPQYGGYCAYAIAARSKKVSIDPETYEIRDNKLYLFYKTWFSNTYESWMENAPDKLKVKADKNWEKIMQE